MLGGGKFPGLMEENRFQYDKTALTQLHLLGNVPTQYTGGLGTTNFAGNEHATVDARPTKRVREEEPLYMQQKLRMSSSNNLYQHKPVYVRPLLNSHPLSPGLRLSTEKEEHSSSVTSTSENLSNVFPGVLSLGDTVKTEIDRQMDEFTQYIKLQEENIIKGGRELNERQTISLLKALEKVVTRKLHEKELEIENINQRNKELEDKIKQFTIEAQSWQYKAKYNESVANILKSNIQQLRAQGTGALVHEGFGDSEVDDALSCIKHPGIVSGFEDQEFLNSRLKCRSCKVKQVSILLFPCRHLCLCADCEGFVDVCPVCQVVKTAGVPVNL